MALKYLVFTRLSFRFNYATKQQMMQSQELLEDLWFNASSLTFLGCILRDILTYYIISIVNTLSAQFPLQKALKTKSAEYRVRIEENDPQKYIFGYVKYLYDKDGWKEIKYYKNCSHILTT